ncbi:hypothetical protein HPB49_001185 [Dermacentor silvarum]|uniref:Uncharacterized protein n=1 Tax=Dermacentor silvarum TaxID=543639 RepID=A0ACB8DA04_DERSI|nr:hypothetical protein HPB49_001185 [Dermacentor silvarum]
MHRLPRRVVYCQYRSSLKVQSHKRFSSSSSSSSLATKPVGNETKEDQGASTIRNGREISLFGPKDLRVPLPGNVGVVPIDFGVTPVAPERPKTCDVLSRETNSDRYHNILAQFLSPPEELLSEAFGGVPGPPTVLECNAQDCPDLLKKDFQDLFPARNIFGDPLTVITLTQKTENDMTYWSEDVDVEREELTGQFVMTARKICRALQEAGYWADFIDPCSGRPSLGPYTNATLLETDERYRHFGFTIEDLGCCKDFPEAMMKHRDNRRYVQWNLDNMATLMAKHFPSAHCIVVRPNRLQYLTFSCYDNFVEGNDMGAPTHEFSITALEHLLALLNSLSSRLRDKTNKARYGPIATGVLELPLVLIGFSKGCIVLNQFLYAIKALEVQPDDDVIALVRRIKAMYWLDGGHSGGSNTWVTKEVILKSFRPCDIKVYIHVTPYQVLCSSRPWIGKEEKVFRETLKNWGLM